ncbi:ATP-dependent RNA helicase [bacterium]|nr:ATP-dependent RNA helicase [bacterium]
MVFRRFEKNFFKKSVKEKKKIEKGLDKKLPIFEYREKIKEVVKTYPFCIIVGETSSGKTTQIPLIIREILQPKDKIAITQPRRVAVRSISRYVAERINSPIGDEVGYQIRFEDMTTKGTKINFMTDGILLRKIQEDPLLKEYSVVMIDEAHERSLNIDFTLGLLKKAQREREEKNLPHLKVIVSSATIEKEKFAQYFENAPITEIPGRLYPVKIHYEKEPVLDYCEKAAEKVEEILKDPKRKEGDILIFMPGQEEIERTIRKIEERNLENIVCLPLFGLMEPEDQDKIFEETPHRKIIVATNIAETSVTAPGIRYVIDSGLIKQKEYDPSLGIETLITVPHAKSGCIQRAGRAGRWGPGECWRLYSEEDFEKRPEFQKPEIQRSNLSHVILQMKKIGIEDVENFDFIDPPPKEAIKSALEELKTLGILDEEEKLTKEDELLSEIPLEPRIGKAILEAKKYNCVQEVCKIVSFLGLRSVFMRPKGKETEADLAHQKFKVPGSDFLTLLKVWEDYENSNYSNEWARKNFLHWRTLKEAKDIQYQLFRILKYNGVEIEKKTKDPELIGKSIAAGLINNLMSYYSYYRYLRIRDGEIGFYIHPSSSLFNEMPRFLVAAEIIKTKKPYVRFCQTVKPEWLKDIAPHWIEKKIRDPYYDFEKDKVVRKIEYYLKNEPDPVWKEIEEATKEEASEVIAEMLAEKRLDFPFIVHNEKVLQFLKDLWIRTEGKINFPFK